MSKPKESLDRRTFLRGALSTMGASVLTLGGASAQGIKPLLGGTIDNVPGKSTSVLAYWDGARLIPAEQLPMGDPTIEYVDINIHGFGSVSTFTGVDANAIVPDRGRVPFRAFTAGPNGVSQVQFRMHVNATQGVVLTVKKPDGVVDIQLMTGKGKTPKLKEGVYVLALNADLTQFRYDGTRPDGPLTPLGAASIPQYAIVTVTRS